VPYLLLLILNYKNIRKDPF